MAVLRSLSEFEGSIGNITAYKRRDSDKTFLRIKGGVSKKRIKKDKKFERTRELNAEWGGCAKAAATIRNLFVEHQSVADYNLSGPLTAIAKEIQVRNTSDKHGERAILFSRFGHLLEGFQLNRKNTFESIIRGNVGTQFFRSEGKAIIELPELIPDISFIPPVSLPAFRICITVGTLPDQLFIDGNYAISDAKTNHFQIGAHFSSPWYYTGNQVPAQTIELLLPNLEQLWPHELLLITISVSFGKPLTQELIKPIKYTGAGKILKTIAGEF